MLFKHGNCLDITKVLFKLGGITVFHNIWSEIFVNNVVLKEMRIESLYHSLSEIVKALSN